MRRGSAETPKPVQVRRGSFGRRPFLTCGERVELVVAWWKRRCGVSTCVPLCGLWYVFEVHKGLGSFYRRDLRVRLQDFRVRFLAMPMLIRPASALKAQLALIMSRLGGRQLESLWIESADGDALLIVLSIPRAPNTIHADSSGGQCFQIIQLIWHILMFRTVGERAGNTKRKLST